MGYASRRRPHGACLTIWPPPAAMARAVRSRAAWTLSSGKSGRSTSMSSYRRMRQCLLPMGMSRCTHGNAVLVGTERTREYYQDGLVPAPPAAIPPEEDFRLGSCVFLPLTDRYFCLGPIRTELTKRPYTGLPVRNNICG